MAIIVNPQENPDDYFDYPARRKHEELLNGLVDKPLNIFASAVDELSKDFNKKIVNLDKDILQIREEIRIHIDYAKEEGDEETPDKVFDLAVEIDLVNDEIDWIKEQLLSLAEMKIAFLHKNLEITLKRLVLNSYDSYKSNMLNRWEDIISPFQRAGIKIENVDGYIEAAELKDVNNRIKHDGEINDRIKNIREFMASTNFDSNNLELFYNRVYPKVNVFLHNLCKLLIDNLYNFSDEQLKQMVKRLTDKMDKPTFNKLIAEMQSKI